jgi:hypothetical protein
MGSFSSSSVSGMTQKSLSEDISWCSSKDTRNNYYIRRGETLLHTEERRKPTREIRISGAWREVGRNCCAHGTDFVVKNFKGALIIPITLVCAH